LTAAAELRSTYPETTVHVYPCDVSYLARVQEVFKDIKEKIGELDILVSSAAPLQKGTPIAAAPATLFLENFNVKVMGNVNLMKYLLGSFPPSPPTADS
jgi:NAD(P)-dependent dehydrogenase (short-subunit alcohol dehydrogenase family)